MDVRPALSLLWLGFAGALACSQGPTPSEGGTDDVGTSSETSSGEGPQPSDTSTGTTGPDATSTGSDALCELGGISLEPGETRPFFDTAQVPLGDTCEAHSQLRTCGPTGLDGDDAYDLPACEVSGQLLIHVEADGDDRNDGRTAQTPVRTLARAFAVLASFAGQYEDASITCGPGRFEHDGELQMLHPVDLLGAGQDATVLAFALNRDQASLRVLSTDIEISDLEIEVDLTESLNDGIHVGGRGEYGTAITLGRYLSTQPHEEVSRVSVHDVRIRRTNFTAAAVTIIGRSSEVDIRDLEILGRTSTAVIVHWGGHSTVAPAPAAIDDPRYAVLTSYHPHGLHIDGVRVENTARLAVLSSSYDVQMRNFEGPTSAMLIILPGDEIDRFAAPEDAGRIMSELTFEGFTAPLTADEGEYVVRVSTFGTSRMDGQRRLLEASDLRIADFTVSGVERPGGLSYRYGINANGTRGENIRFENIDLADVGSWEYDDSGATQASFGVYLRDATGITVDTLQSQARYGVGILDSQQILIDNATLTYDDDPPSDANAFGVYAAENSAPQGANEGLVVAHSTLTGYDYGVRYLDGPGGPVAGCATLVLDEVEFVGVGQETLCVSP